MTLNHNEVNLLNSAITDGNPNIYSLFSKKGKEIYFPSKGVLQQGNAAKGKRINATIGMAIEDNMRPMHLQSLDKWIPLDPLKVYPYAPSYGISPLRKRWQDLIKEKNPSLNSDISLPVVTNGITHALSIICYLFVNEDENIVLSDKYWENYDFIFQYGGKARLNLFNTFSQNGFDVASMEEKLEGKNKKQIMILNFPHNPTGYTISVNEAERITEILKKSADRNNKILVLLDDAYFGLVYEDGVLKESLFSKLAQAHPNILAVKMDGVTKEDYAWGFRIGFITYGCQSSTEALYKALEAKTAGAIRGNISSGPHLSQSLLLNALTSTSYSQEKKEKYNLLSTRYLVLKSTLEENREKYKPYFKPLPFNSGYFMCVQLNPGLDAEVIRITLLEKFSTGVIAIDSMIRIAFSSVSEKDIPTIFDNLYHACQMFS
jgi:aspartate/methionine/tyrosine aminotransferase